MYKNWLIVFVSFIYYSGVLGQELNLAPCGTVAAKSEWLKQYQSGHIDFRDDEETMYVPLGIHVVGNDDGLWYYDHGRIQESICQLNSDYSEANIVFYIEGEIQYINSSEWYDHETVIQGAEMMFQNNYEHQLNCYFLENPAHNCGYSLPYGGIALSKSCLGVGSHTWAHEAGHALSLPHPFLGWEGGVSYDGSVGHSYGNPAPTEVYYDYTLFKDSLYLDTLIIDTALVELVDGSNCAIAADGFCDTAPDYLSYRWQCNSSAMSLTEQTDPTGAKFHSDATLIMAYPLDQCQTRFSPEQIQAMRAFLLDVKPDWLNHETPMESVTETAALLSPIESQMVQYENVLLKWRSVPHATEYYLRLYKKVGTQGVAPVGKYIIENDTTLLLTDLKKNKTYYWEVKPTNRYSFCTDFSVRDTFLTVEEIVGINHLSNDDFIIFPTTVSVGEELTIISKNADDGVIDIRLLDITGKLISRKEQTILSGKNSWTIPVPVVPEGMYIVAIEIGEKRLYRRFFVTDK